jgi:hypothetical protein
MEEEVKEKKITQYLESKEIIGEKTNLNILGGAKKIDIKGGYHIIKISSHVETLTVFGGYREINIKSLVDNLIIKGGVSKIYVHNFNNAQVNNIDITGGNHKLTIYSFVNELNIRGGINKVILNYEHSRINKIKTVGGQRDFYLNPNTENAIQKNEGGICKIHKTEIIPEPIWYQESLFDNEIPITTISAHKIKENCTICLNEFKIGDKVYFLPCIHCFHVPCLKEWVKSQKNCPICKFQFKNKLA